MFSKNEIRLFDKRYFNILRITHEENFVEIQSKNTKDYWVIKKMYIMMIGRYIFITNIHVQNIIIGIGNAIVSNKV